MRRLRPVDRLSDVSEWDDATISDEERKWQWNVLFLDGFMPFLYHSVLQVVERAEYAGYEFRTAKSQRNIKTDNSLVRMDYLQRRPGSQVRYLQSLFGTINKMFLHTAFLEGPTKLIICCTWFETVGRCPVAGNQLVRENSELDWNRDSRHCFLETCYQVPVAIWPCDPLNLLPGDDPRRLYYDVIDRNQDQES